MRKKTQEFASADRKEVMERLKSIAPIVSSMSPAVHWPGFDSSRVSMTCACSTIEAELGVLEGLNVMEDFSNLL